jgi:hypothetical protein
MTGLSLDPAKQTLEIQLVEQRQPKSSRPLLKALWICAVNGDTCRRTVSSQKKRGIDAVQPRHIEIEDRDVATQSAGDADRVVTVRGFYQRRDTRYGKHCAHIETAYRVVVVCDENAHSGLRYFARSAVDGLFIKPHGSTSSIRLARWWRASALRAMGARPHFS